MGMTSGWPNLSFNAVEIVTVYIVFAANAPPLGAIVIVVRSVVLVLVTVKPVKFALASVIEIEGTIVVVSSSVFAVSRIDAVLSTPRSPLLNELLIRRSGAVLNVNALTSPGLQLCVHLSRLPEQSVVDRVGDWLPSVAGLQTSYYALYEMLGYALFRLVH